VFYRLNIAFKLKIVCSDIKVYPKVGTSWSSKLNIRQTNMWIYVYSLPWSMGTQTFILKFVLLSLANFVNLTTVNFPNCANYVGMTGLCSLLSKHFVKWDFLIENGVITCNDSFVFRWKLYFATLYTSFSMFLGFGTSLHCLSKQRFSWF
jgi:hypothetical protein